MDADTKPHRSDRLRATGIAWATLPRALVVDGRPGHLELRRADPRDGAALAAMHARCTVDSILRRYLFAVPAVSVRWQAELVATSLAVVAADPERAQVHALGTVADLDGGSTAELAVLVEDAWQGRGIGTAMARHLAALAWLAGYRIARMDVLPSSVVARHVAELLGPLVAVVGVGVTRLTLPLRVEALGGLSAA